MDFIDPKTERRNRLVLLVGYCFVAVAIVIATLLLLYQSTGFNLDSKGKVIQNGLLFVSSQPNGADIVLNDKLYKSKTNSRVIIPADTYSLKIQATGYRDWQRQVVVNGGDVQHFDYPFLFPSTLETKSLGDLAAAPTLATQSPGQRWLITDLPGESGGFRQYDMKDPFVPIATNFSLPASAYTAGDGAQTWKLVEWASDNKHVLLSHTYIQSGSPSVEYVLVNRDDPTASLNLTKTLSLTAGETVGLFDQKVAQVYVFNAVTKSLRRTSVADGTQISKLDHILAYKPYGDDQLLYVTDQPPTGKTLSGQVSAVLQDGQKTVTLRTLPAGAPTYVLNMARYDGDWYVAAGAANDSGVYIYKNPQSAVLTAAAEYPDAYRLLSVKNPSYAAFSSNTQYLAVESGQAFAVFDFENMVQYRYTTTQPLDQPQTHATWMDGNRLTYVSGGRLLVFDYDYRNKQTLQAADSQFLPFFSGNYRDSYTFRPNSTDQKPALTLTPFTTDKQ